MNKKNITIVTDSQLIITTLLTLLELRNFPAQTVQILSSEIHKERSFLFKGKTLFQELISEEKFNGQDIAFFFVDSKIALEFIPTVIEKNVLVIDSSEAYRMNEEIPLVVPEVNAQSVLQNSKLIANPNSAAIFLTIVLKSIQNHIELDRVVVSTYQGLSDGLETGMKEGIKQFEDYFNGRVLESHYFSHPVAFNLIPQIGKVLENNYYSEEMSLILETQKILSNQNLKISATAVRVPIMRTQSLSIMVETKDKIEIDSVKQWIREFKNLNLWDDPLNNIYPMPLNTTLKDDIFVGRIRKDLSSEKGILLWVTGDQILKGSTLNALQIAEFLLNGIEE